MPPKPKFSKEQIVDTALQLVIDNGIDALTARSLGEMLGSSARPVFTVFCSMEEVRQEVMLAAQNIYDTYVERGLQEEIPFKGVGTAYIRFADEYPKLFQLLFMCEKETHCNLDNVLGTIDANKNKILQSIVDSYGLPQNVAMQLYTHLWIYTHGIAVLIATRMCAFTESEISEMLTLVFVGILKQLKGEAKQ